jgi:hypothetical protein
MPSRPVRALAGAASTFALVAAGLAATTSAAPAAPAAPAFDACPEAYDITGLVPGVSTVTGLTTVSGTTPEEFHGTYLGTIEDGIGPGMDLPVFDMAGSRITHPDGSVDAGIWAGMSGSPVYDDATGRLVGAVSYGFSYAASPKAGVTPAEYLYALGASGARTAKFPATIKPSAQEAKAIGRAAADPAPLGTGRLVKTVKQVSGTPADKANSVAARSPLLQKGAAYKSGGFRAAGSARSAATDYPIVVGGNLATTFSTGDVTTAAVGTVTAICGDQVYAFGHADEFTGTSTQTFNGASAVTVQEDGGLGQSFKIANVGKVKGVITQDRSQGILGTLGDAPTPAQVVTHAAGPDRDRDATTDVSVQAALPYVVSTQVYNDAIAVLNQNAGGDALMTWTVDYTRKGKAQTFTRTQRFSVARGFADAVSYDAASDVEALLGNGFERIRVDKVTVSTDYAPDYRAYQITGAQYFKAGSWRPLARWSNLKAKPGTKLQLRVKLGPADLATDVAPVTVPLKVLMPTIAKKSGSIRFEGLNQPYGGWDDDEDEDFGYVDEEDELGSLDELLDTLASIPRNDDILRQLHYRTKGSTVDRFTTVRSPGVVTGGFSFGLSFPK